MPVYNYKALDQQGKKATGVIEADTPKEARAKLRSKGLLPTTINAERSSSKTNWLTAPRIFRSRAEAETANFTRQLATLVKSGIPVADALRILIEQAENPGLSKAVVDVNERVMQGSKLADALRRHPRYFSDLYVNMVESGEESGNLDIVLDTIAEYLQRRHRLASKIQATLAYPVVVLFFGLAVVIFLLTFVVPKIAEFLIQNNRTPPLTTSALLFISRFLTNYWYIIVGGLGVFTVFLRMFFNTPTGKNIKDKFLISVPVIGPLYRKSAVSRFALTFSTLLKSGLPALRALEIVGKVVDNVVLERTIQEVHDRIIEGADISTPLKQSGVFPPVVGYMIAVGERSGRLEEILDRIAEAYDEEVEITAQKIMSMIEPVFIVILAVVVGFIVMSVILPILDLSTIR